MEMSDPKLNFQHKILISNMTFIQYIFLLRQVNKHIPFNLLHGQAIYGSLFYKMKLQITVIKKI